MNKYALAIFCMFILGSGFLRADGSLTFNERAAAQEAIERVYYEHRLWPKENTGPKPPFETAVPAAAILRRAEDPLFKAAALRQYWRQEITHDQIVKAIKSKKEALMKIKEAENGKVQ